MSLDNLLKYYIAAEREWQRLHDERLATRKRDKQLSRALTRLELVHYDLLRQMRLIASQKEIEAAVDAVNKALDPDDEIEWNHRFAYVPKPSAYDEELEVSARQKLVVRKRR